MREKIDPGDEESNRKMKAFFGPGHVDQMIRQAISNCWMMLPDDKKNVEEVERQVRRLVDRALRELREDTDAFGLKE